MSHDNSKLRINILLVLTFSIATAIVIYFQVSHYQYYKQEIKERQDFEKIINQARKQRIYSQLLAKAFLLYIDQSIAQDETPEIQENLELLKSTNLGLLEINQKINDPVMDSLYTNVTLLQSKYTSEINRVLKSENPVDDLEPIHVMSDSYLDLMNQIIARYEFLAARNSQLKSEESLSKQLSSIIFVFICSLSALIITLLIIRHYHKNLAISHEMLERSLASEKMKSDRIELMVNSVNIGIWEKDLHNNEEKWSRTFYEILEYSPETDPFSDELFNQLIHPDDLPRLLAAFEHAMITGESEAMELRIKTKSGNYKWIEARGNTLKNEEGHTILLFGAISDIHTKKTLQNQLKVFIERAPAAIAMFDKNMKYLANSDKWIEAYGLKDQTLVGKSHYEVFPEISDEWKQIHQEALKGIVNINNEAPFARQDGTTQWLKWEVRPWYISDDEIGGILIFTDDISEARHQKDALEKAKHEAEKASKAKADFLTTMSHEIRTPLNAINGITHLLMVDSPRPEQVDQLKLLKFSSENLMNLINDILDISKIQAGKISWLIEPFELKYLLESIRLTLDFKAKEKLIDLQLIIDASLSKVYKGDVKRITQILYNLVGNAIKFTESGSVKIVVTKVGDHQDSSSILFEVIDTGIGIAEENKSRIFGYFEQEDAGITRNYGGSGLGLYITSKLLELMKSKIQLESTPGKGSNFSFVLNLEESKENTIVSNRYLNYNNPDFSAGQLRILIVEDNLSNALILGNFLKNSKIEYTHVVNGKEAIKLLERDQDFDLVFMDLRMPVMDGFTATAYIRQMSGKFYQELPIIALTADAFVDIKEEALRMGMNNYLSKPFKPSSLYFLIEKYCKCIPVNNTDKDDKSSAKENQGSRIRKIMERDAKGNENYIINLSNLSVENYQEFIQKFQLAADTGNQELLHEITHKIKALNLFFELTEFENIISDFKKNDLKNASKSAVEAIVYAAHEIIHQLKKVSKIAHDQ